MFETVVPERVAPRSRKIFYEALPLSIALHLIAGGAVLTSSIWDVAFPTDSPRMYMAFQLAAAPPPPPPPPPPLVRRVPVTQARAVPVKMPLVAPTIIPDEIPVVIDEPPVTEVPSIPVAVEGGQAGGVEGGIEGGEIGGELGGTIGGVTTTPPPPPPKVIEIKRDDPLPMGAIAQEFPPYPEYALKRNWEDSLVVRYIIGKDGRIKEVSIIKAPEREEFARQTLSTIRHWRFHPYRDVNGEAKEVVHELTVNFNIVRKKPGAR